LKQFLAIADSADNIIVRVELLDEGTAHFVVVVRNEHTRSFHVGAYSGKDF
jgi:hypothetical protein